MDRLLVHFFEEADLAPPAVAKRKDQRRRMARFQAGGRSEIDVAGVLRSSWHDWLSDVYMAEVGGTHQVRIHQLVLRIGAEEIGIGPRGILRCAREAAVILVEIARTLRVFVILGEC